MQFLRGTKNEIEKTKQNNMVITDKNEIFDIFNSCFKCVFSSGNNVSFPDLNVKIYDLDLHMSYQNMFSRIFGIHAKKSPDAENLPSEFLKQYAGIIAKVSTVIFMCRPLVLSL